MPEEIEDPVGSNCSICHEEIDYYAYGSCNHPTCTKCILKLRKFGSADESDFSSCPTCRRNINKIVLLEKFIPFEDIVTANMRHDPKYDFFFPSSDIERHYLDMLKSRCPICDEEKRSLSALNRHMSMEHDLFYCDLCIRYSRLLPCEFVPMKREQLMAHRRWDKEGKRGHPMCDFCEERFYEMEDLIRHIRDNHFLCDLCMTTGNFVVFRQQNELLQHYEDSHYLCRECRATQRIACYATADRLGMHRFQEHPDEVANEPDAWLPVTIQHTPVSTFLGTSSRERQEGNQSADQSIRGTIGGTLVAEGTESGIRFRRPNPSEWTGGDFPSLRDSAPTTASGTSHRGAGMGPASVVQTTTPSTTNGCSTTSESMAARAGRGRNLKLMSDDFPSLAGSPSTAVSTTAPKWTKKSAASAMSSKPQSSQPQAPNRLANVVKTQSKPTQNESDFPSLSDGPAVSQGDYTPGWTPASSAPKSSSKKLLPTKSIPSSNDFPGLSSPAKHITVPLTTSIVEPPVRQTPKQTQSAVQKSNKTKPAKKSQQPSENFLQTTAPISLSAKSKLRQQRNPDVRHALSQAWTEQNETREEIHSVHIRTVDSFIDPDGEKPESNANPAEFSAFDFPTLTGGSDSTGSSLNNHKSLKQNEKKNESKSSAPKKPDVDQNSWPRQHNSSVDTECILFADKKYVHVTDSELRNRELINLIQNKLFDFGGKTAFTRFADISRRYSHRQLTAVAYMEALSGLLTARSNSADLVSDPPLWIAEMLALLPDIGLQRALLRVLQGQGAPRLPGDGVSNKRRDAIPPSPIWSKPVLKMMRCCSVCGQVCLREDMAQHTQQAHSEV